MPGACEMPGERRGVGRAMSSGAVDALYTFTLPGGPGGWKIAWLWVEGCS